MVGAQRVAALQAGYPPERRRADLKAGPCAYPDDTAAETVGRFTVSDPPFLGAPA